MRSIWQFIEGLLVAFIGRPILWFIKYFRWMLLLLGFCMNTISTYNPQTIEATNERTFIPLIIGIIMFSIGSTIHRYDELTKLVYMDEVTNIRP